MTDQTILLKLNYWYIILLYKLDNVIFTIYIIYLQFTNLPVIKRQLCFTNLTVLELDHLLTLHRKLYY